MHLAESLEEAHEMVKKLFSAKLKRKPEPYFEKEYYDKLPELFDKVILRNEADRGSGE